MGAVNKTFVSNLLMLIGVNLLIKPFYLLVIEAQVQERIGAENFGIYFALLNLSFILNILPDLGITNWNNRHIARQGVIHRFELNKLMKIRLLLGVIYIIVCVLISSVLSYDIDSILILLVLALNQVLASGILFMRSYLSGMHLFAADRIISVSDRVLLILLLGGALLMTDSHETFSIEYLVFGQTIAYGITLLLAFYFVWRLTSKGNTHHTAESSSILTSSLPFATLILVSMISNRADAIMLERMSDSFQAGVYAMTFRLGDMLTMIAYLFAVMLLPIFSRLLALQKSPVELFGIAFRMLLVGCTWVVAISILCPNAILEAVYNNHIEEAALILPWTMASAALFSLQYTTGTLLTAGGRMTPLIFISFFALICNISLNFILIPQKQALGVAQSACITQALVFIFQSIMAHIKYRIWFKPMIIRSILFLFISCGALLLLHTEHVKELNAMMCISVIILSGAFVMNMLPIKDMFYNLKSETTQNPS